MKLNDKIKGMVDTMVGLMEETKTLPWDQGFLFTGNPWARNLTTGKVYRGFNLWYLTLVGESASNSFATFKQVQGLGGKVRKGSKGISVSKFGFWDPKKKSEAKKSDEKGTDEEKTLLIPFWKTYTVFRWEDMEGVDNPYVRPQEKSSDYGVVYEEIDSLVQAYAASEGLEVELTDSTQTAYYRPSAHKVVVPKNDNFHSSALYYSTLLHELVHSTMKGLGREKLERAAEEVVAEFGAAMLCGYFGIRKEREAQNEAVYIASWGQTLRSNPEWLFEGANRAQKAVDYILQAAGFLSWEERMAEEVAPAIAEAV